MFLSDISGTKKAHNCYVPEMKVLRVLLRNKMERICIWDSQNCVVHASATH